MDNKLELNNKIGISCDSFSKKNINLTAQDVFGLPPSLDTFFSALPSKNTRDERSGKDVSCKNGENLTYDFTIDINLQDNSELLFKLDLDNLDNINSNNINIIINAQLYFGAKLHAFVFSSANNINIEFNCNLLQNNSEFALKILSYSDINSSCSIKTSQNHIGQNTKSSIVTKRILSSLSSGKYWGNILIDNQAKNSDASQHDTVLILGDNAKNLSVPALEIKNNDVKCKHAFAVYNINEQQKFYLKSRGFDNLQIKQAALTAFIEDICDYNLLDVDNIKDNIKAKLK